MGFVDWLKGTFGKQTCAFCGAEVGMLKRTKIKNKEFICNDCKRTCSRFIQVYRMTKDELLGHMEYMKRQEKLYNEIVGEPSQVVPSASSEQSIEFYDHCGMFRIRDDDYDGRYTKELFRYDQVAKYEPFCNESEPEEAGKPKEFDSCGVTITLVGCDTDASEQPKGLRPHPYITNEIEVVISKNDKHIGMLNVQQIIAHFNNIFGVNDDTNGLFNFGPTIQQKREAAALRSMGGMFAAAVQAAKTGEVSEEMKDQVQDAMNKVDDAATSGLSKYTRLADEAEAKLQ